MQITPKDAHNLYYLRILSREHDVLRFVREYLLALDTFGIDKVLQIDTGEILKKRGMHPYKAMFLKDFCLWLAEKCSPCKNILRQIVDRVIADALNPGSLEEAQMKGQGVESEADDQVRSRVTPATPLASPSQLAFVFAARGAA